MRRLAPPTCKGSNITSQPAAGPAFMRIAHRRVRARIRSTACADQHTRPRRERDAPVGSAPPGVAPRALIAKNSGLRFRRSMTRPSSASDLRSRLTYSFLIRSQPRASGGCGGKTLRLSSGATRVNNPSAQRFCRRCKRLQRQQRCAQIGGQSGAQIQAAGFVGVGAIRA